MSNTLHLYCPRCSKGAGLIHVAKRATRKRKCRQCHDEWTIVAERQDDGKIEVTWNLTKTRWPVPKELMS